MRLAVGIAVGFLTIVAVLVVSAWLFGTSAGAAKPRVLGKCGPGLPCPAGYFCASQPGFKFGICVKNPPK